MLVSIASMLSTPSSKRGNPVPSHAAAPAPAFDVKSVHMQALYRAKYPSKIRITSASMLVVMRGTS